MARRIIKQNLAPEYTTFAEAFDEFITEKEARNLSAPSLKSYSYTYKAFCEFHGFDSDTVAEEITLHHVLKWINTLRLNGVKPASMNHYLRDLRVILYWCMDTDRGYISKPYKIQLISGQEEQLKLYSDDDLLLLLEKPRRNDSFVTWRTWVIVNWVLGTGNRAATICDVKITDVNFARQEIILGHTKNKKAEIIPLSSSLAVVLKEYIKAWRRDAPVDGWLFPNVGEEKLTTNGLHSAFKRYCAAKGVERTNIHGLRHNFAKGWVRNNGNMFALQKILGHSTLDMTRKYVKLFAEDIKVDYDSFSPLDTIKKKAKRTQVIKKFEE